MKDIFRLCTTKKVQRGKYKFNLGVPKSTRVIFGTGSLLMQDPKVWNSQPYHIEVAENLEIFQSVVKFDMERPALAMIAKFIIRNLIHKMTALIYGTDVTNIRCSILGWCILVYFVKPTLNK